MSYSVEHAIENMIDLLKLRIEYAEVSGVEIAAVMVGFNLDNSENMDLMGRELPDVNV